MKVDPSMQRIVWRLKGRLAKVLCTDGMGRLLARVLNDRIPYRGIAIDTSDPVFSARSKAQMFWRVYESAECRFVQRHLQGTKFAIELGSSLGVVAAHLARAMADGGRLMCVEANPALLPALEAALTRMQGAKHFHVEVIHAAVVADPKQREASLVLGDETVGSKIVDPLSSDGKVVNVPAVTLSEVVERSAFPEFALVSDIEGAEISFILSDPAALRLCRRMVIELHDVSSGPRQVRSEELLQVLIANGFRLVDRRGPVVVLDQTAGRVVS